MYDKEMFERTVLSPFLSHYDSSIAYKEMEDGILKNVRGIVIEPYQVHTLNELVAKYPDTKIRRGITLGYPFGGQTTKMKVEIAKFALDNDIEEIDIGINVGALLSDDIDTVKRDLEPVINAVGHKINIIPISWVVKLPLETIDKICEAYIELGLRTLKTSAGLYFGEMKVDHIEYLYKHYGDKLEIEVAGRTRTRQKCEDMLDAGAQYFHLSQWRRICEGKQDYIYDYFTKVGGYGEYNDRFC